MLLLIRIILTLSVCLLMASLSRIITSLIGERLWFPLYLALMFIVGFLLAGLLGKLIDWIVDK